MEEVFFGSGIALVCTLLTLSWHFVTPQPDVALVFALTLWGGYSLADLGHEKLTETTPSAQFSFFLKML